MPVMYLSVSVFGIIPLRVCYPLRSVYLCFQSNLGSFGHYFFKYFVLLFLSLTPWTPVMCMFVPVIISLQNVKLLFFFILFYLLLGPNNFNCPFFKFTDLFACLNILWKLFREFVVLVIMLFSSRFCLIILSNFYLSIDIFVLSVHCFPHFL